MFFHWSPEHVNNTSVRNVLSKRTKHCKPKSKNWNHNIKILGIQSRIMTGNGLNAKKKKDMFSLSDWDRTDKNTNKQKTGLVYENLS